MTVNWFDVVFVGVLGVGLFRGRNNGMSNELLPLLRWLSVVIISGFFYPAVSQLLMKVGGLNLLMAYVSGYIVLTLAVFLVFSQIKRVLGPKLADSERFGNAEYYLGMLSGVVRFACMLLFVLAFLHARSFTADEIKAGNEYQQHWLGAHYFPTLCNVQEQVFEKSFTGHGIQSCLGGLLIKSTPLHEGQPEQGPVPVS